MGLFDDIKRTITEAIEEAKQASSPTPQRKAAPAPRRHLLQEDEDRRVELSEEAQREAAAQRKRDEAKARRAREERAEKQRRAAIARRRRNADEALDAHQLRALLKNPSSFRQAIILGEVLGPPKAKQSPGTRRF